MQNDNFANGNTIEYFKIDIQPVQPQIYTNIGETGLVAYNGVSPGSTFHRTKGIDAVVRFTNVDTVGARIYLQRACS